MFLSFHRRTRPIPALGSTAIKKRYIGIGMQVAEMKEREREEGERECEVKVGKGS